MTTLCIILYRVQCMLEKQLMHCKLCYNIIFVFLFETLGLYLYLMEHIWTQPYQMLCISEHIVVKMGLGSTASFTVYCWLCAMPRCLFPQVAGLGKTPVRIILWCPITKMLIKACFLVQPLEQEGVYQKCCISLCSKVFIKHFYQMKASPECLNILTYCSKYWVDRLRRTIGRKV